MKSVTLCFDNDDDYEYFEEYVRQAKSRTGTVTGLTNGLMSSAMREVKVFIAPRPNNSYRIQTADGRFLGTGGESWFSLDEARIVVRRENGERIVEHDGMNVLWEVL
jgi:hypothetical protein